MNCYTVIFRDEDGRQLSETNVKCKNKVIATEKAFSRCKEWRQKDRVAFIQIVEDSQNQTDHTNYQV